MTVLNANESRAYIDGAWVDAQSGQTFQVFNPSNREQVAEVADCGEIDVRKASEAAKRAFSSWSSKPAKERAACLHKIAENMKRSDEALAKILVEECGKPLREAIGEIRYGASYFQWFAEEAVRAYGEVIPANSPANRFIATKHPIGVCALITPWNFPNAMLARKTAAALAAGCTVIAKPAEDTPLSALALGQILEQAGIPSGVFNVIPSSRREEMGTWITQDPNIAKISFTGSTPVGRKLFEMSGSTLKKLSLELGGNAPFIIFDDADLDAAIDGVMASKFRNAGQTCICTNRVFVHASIEETFAEMLTQRVAQLKVGSGQDPNTDVGPLINQRAAEKVSSLVTSACSEGAKVLIGGSSAPQGELFYDPTVLGSVTNEMKIAREEIFGPVVTLIPFESDDDVIEMANSTEFGLAAYMYSDSVKRAWRVSEELEYGMIGINESAISNAEIPFGGIKQSGQGREGSKHGLDDYMEIKFRLFGGIC